MKYFILILMLILIIGCSQQQVQESELQKQETEVFNMKITSSAFEDEQNIPSEYTCDGEGVSPPLKIEDIPPETRSLVLIADDPDAPAGTWVHWIVFNIPPTVTEIPKGTEPAGKGGTNSWGKKGYGGPCPPSGTHRYFFKLYALNTELQLSEGASKTEVEAAMEGRIIEQAQVMGKYQRQ